MAVTQYGGGVLEANGFEQIWGAVRYDRKFVSDGGWDRIAPGGHYHDYLVGGGGHDTLIGGAGCDIIQGSSRYSNHGDIDYLTGGTGSLNWGAIYPADGQQDIFVIGDAGGNYYNGSGYAVITDFENVMDNIMLKRGSGGNGGTGIVVGVRNFGVGGAAQDTVITNTSGDVLVVLQDQQYTFSQLNYDALVFV